MKKFSCLLFLFFSCLTTIFAGDLLDETLAKAKNETHEKSHKDLEPIVKYVKSKKLSEKDLEKIKEIILIYYENRRYVSYFGDTLEIALALKKEQRGIILPLFLKILEDPKEMDSGARSILLASDVLFDDVNGEMILKYKRVFKDTESFLSCIMGSNNFNEKRYKTFRENLILILGGEEKLVIEQLYKNLKSTISFIDCIGEKHFEALSDGEKAIEIKKMRDWLTKTTDLEIAYDKFTKDFVAKISKLTKDNYDEEMITLKKNYEFLDRMENLASNLMLDPFDETDQGFALGLKIVIDEMQSWIDLNKTSFAHYSTFQWDLLVREIQKKLREKRELFRGESKLDPFRESMIKLKAAVVNKDTKSDYYGRKLAKSLKNEIKKSNSERHKEFYQAMLKEIHELCPAVLASEKEKTDVIEDKK